MPARPCHYAMFRALQGVVCVSFYSLSYYYVTIYLIKFKEIRGS